jgi:DNA-binding response OmpR family regulator
MKPRILLIDNSTERRTAIRFMLQEKHFQVLETDDVQESLKNLNNLKCDLIMISDRLNEEAFVLIQMIRDHESTYTPIVLLGHELREEPLTTARKAGISAYLDQPYYLKNALAFRHITTKILKKASLMPLARG